MEETTPKRIEANRENGKLGGVKTPEGKAISRYNAIKHGLLSKEVILADENEADLIGLGKKLRSELVPENELELMLVDRITANIWRLRRAMRIEREMMEDDFHGTLSMDTQTLGKAMSSDFAYQDTYGKLIRYEASIERGIYKALHELLRLQGARNGETVPLPIAIDIGLDQQE